MAWNLLEKDQIAITLKYDWGATVIFLITAILTVVRDITAGIAVGVTLGSLIFMRRMARMVTLETHEAILDDDQADSGDSDGWDNGRDPDFIVYRISGPFVFGAASMVAAALDHIGRRPKAFVLDLKRVPLADGAAANALRGFIERERRHDVRVAIRSVSRDVLRTLLFHGVNSRVVHFSVEEDDAREYFRLHPEAGAF